MKDQAQVVIIGGGIMGVSLLYHLSREGWQDIMLIEKSELTSGSTWHAAGLIPHFIGDINMARIHLYGSQLYQQLEAETGQATGWHGCGSIRLALNQDEVDWFHQVQGILRYVGAECHLLSAAEIKKIHPLLELDDVLLGAYTPGDGHTDSSSTTNALAIGARQRGAEIIRHNRVLSIQQHSSGEWIVETEKGSIRCQHLVNAAGSFGDRINNMVNLQTPMVNMVHQYLVTENLAAVMALEKELPVIRDPGASCYYRQEQNGLLIGPYETADAKAWGIGGVDWSFDMELLEPELERLETSLDFAMKRIPCFAQAGIKRIVSGPITHTPDGNFLLGPAPGRRNFWLACGASIGITQGAGCGKYLAQWMVHGQTEINMVNYDPRRFGPWADEKYCIAKGIDEYQQMYQVPYPGESREAGRPLVKTPIYERLEDRGANFTAVFGWERAKWFSADGEVEQYSFRRNNSFNAVAAECQAATEHCAVVDLSGFSKFDITGKDAQQFLNRLGANQVPQNDGAVILFHLLGQQGRIEGEATLTRFSRNHYYFLSAAVAQIRDQDWLEQHIEINEDVRITDLGMDIGVLLVTGPDSREVLQSLTETSLSNAAFPWLSAQSIRLADTDLRALRVSYVGELGWELHCPMNRLAHVYDAVKAAGHKSGIRDIGFYAMNSMRMEKAYKAWGSELTSEVTPIEAGLQRFVDFEKEYTGSDIVAKRRDEALEFELVYCEVDCTDADAAGNELVFDGDKLIGITTSGAYGHRVSKSLAFAYVDPSYARPGSEFEIRVLDQRNKARVLKNPAFDPKNQRLRA